MRRPSWLGRVLVSNSRPESTEHVSVVYARHRGTVTGVVIVVICVGIITDGAKALRDTGSMITPRFHHLPGAVEC